MEKNNQLFILGAFWEVARFFLLFLILVSEQKQVSGSFTENLMILWFGAAQLAMSAGFILAGLYPEKYGNYAKLLALGKFLGLLPGIGIFIIQAFVLPFVQIRNVFSNFSFLLLPGLILLIDLIFFLFLLSFKTYEKKKINKSAHNDEEKIFPEYDETRIEED